MNKNLLALSAAVVSASAFSASAAVSSNIVGYVKLNLATGYNLVANPLNNTNPNGNTIGSLFGSVTCDVLRWTGTGFQTTSIEAGEGVIPGTGPDFVLAPGESVFLFNSANNPVSVTLVGEALVGTQTVNGVAGNNFVAAKIPLAGTFVDLGLTPGNGATVATWTGTGYKTYDYVVDPDYTGYLDNGVPADPSLAVGQGLVVNALAPFVWTKTFNPP